MQAALHGNLPTLKREIGRAGAQGKLSRAAVQKLALAVAAREVRSSRGETGTERIEEVKPCAQSLLYVIRDRAQGVDETAASATRLLFELGDVAPAQLIDSYLNATNGAWRAVAARAAVLPKFGLLRRQLLVDPDERVRRAALNAARGTAHPDELESLLEAARLDPDPEARVLAIRAVGAMGGNHPILALKDLWARADDAMRLAIVEAWAEPASLPTGGREQLIVVAEERRGVWSAAAADCLNRRSPSDASLGRAVLAHFIREGTPEERTLAIRVSPLADPDIILALRAAAGSGESSTQVLAWARLVPLSVDRVRAVLRLRQLARGRGHSAFLAWLALGEVGDPGVVQELRTVVNSGNAEERKLAATNLYWLGDAASAAVALADDDPRVRTDVACSILANRHSRE